MCTCVHVCFLGVPVSMFHVVVWVFAFVCVCVRVCVCVFVRVNICLLVVRQKNTQKKRKRVRESERERWVGGRERGHEEAFSSCVCVESGRNWEIKKEKDEGMMEVWKLLHAVTVFKAERWTEGGRETGTFQQMDGWEQVAAMTECEPLVEDTYVEYLLQPLGGSRHRVTCSSSTSLKVAHGIVLHVVSLTAYRWLTV